MELNIRYTQHEVEWLKLVQKNFFKRTENKASKPSETPKIEENLYQKTGSNACKTPLNFLTVKLLWHI